MENIVKRLIENHQLIEGRDENDKLMRGETALRNVLVLIAEELKVDGYDSNETYQLHHLNGKHSDHSLSNLSLIPTSKHSSFNGKLGRRGLKGWDLEALELFSQEYEQYCVHVGEALDKLIKGL